MSPVVCTGPPVYTPRYPLLFRQSVHVYREYACHVQLNVPPRVQRGHRRIRSTVQTPRLASPRPLVHPAAAILLPLKHRRLIIRLCRFNRSPGLEIRKGEARSQRRGIGNERERDVSMIFKRRESKKVSMDAVTWNSGGMEMAVHERVNGRFFFILRKTWEDFSEKNSKWFHARMIKDTLCIFIYNERKFVEY